MRAVVWYRRHRGDPSGWSWLLVPVAFVSAGGVLLLLSMTNWVVLGWPEVRALRGRLRLGSGLRRAGIASVLAAGELAGLALLRGAFFPG